MEGGEEEERPAAVMPMAVPVAEPSESHEDRLVATQPSPVAEQVSSAMPSSSSSSSAPAPASAEVVEVEEKDTLVVFYSRTSTTRSIGQKLAAHLGADLAEIVSAESLSGAAGYVRSAWRAVRKEKTSTRLAESPKVLPRHKVVWIGGPVEVWSVPSALRSWIGEHKSELVAPAERSINGFCTMGASGDSGFFSQIEHVLGVKLAATFSVLHKNAKAWTPEQAPFHHHK